MDLHKIDLNLLLIFSAVMRRRSTTQAGEDLDLSQSGISNGLRRLRLHFGDPLFIKTPLGMTPTPLAERLAGPIQAGLDSIRSAMDTGENFDPQTSTRAFRLYMSDMGQLVLLPRLVKALEHGAPHISLAVVEMPPKQALSLLAEGGIDIAIGTFSSFESGFHSQRLFSKSYTVMARRGHPALRDGLTLAKFLRARFAVFRPAAGSHDDFEDNVEALFQQHGARRLVSVEVAHGLGIVELIGSSDLLICVPRRLAETYRAVANIETAELPFSFGPIDICQFWHHRLHADAGHRWLRSLIFQHYGG
jgi:DNA-binding transcriptional LysR family regulator